MYRIHYIKHTKKILFLFLFFIFSTISFSQTVCNTPNPTNINDYLSTGKTSLNSSQTFCINVKYHIIRKSDQSGGLNLANLTIAHNNLNLVYNTHGIYFVNTGYDYIDNDNYYNITSYYTYIDDTAPAGNPNSIFRQSVDPNALNIYFTEDIDNNSILGEARRIPSTACVVDNQYAHTNVTAHEVGHCLNLIHTFGNKFECLEKVERTNCTTCGDRICDTPADYGLYNSAGDSFVNPLTCQLISNFSNTHNYGPNYWPDPKNIMAYTLTQCMLQFSLGQIERMKNAINAAPELQPIRSGDCLSINGPKSICTSSNYSISSFNNNPVTWSWNNTSIATITTNGNYVTINPIVGNNGFGKLIATSIGLNGAIITKELEVYIGLPELGYTCVGNASQSTTSGSSCLKLCYNTSNLKDNRVQPSLKGGSNTSVWDWQPISSNFTWSIVTTVLGNTTISLAEITPTNTNNVQFKVRVSNSCGWSDWQFYNLPVTNCRNTILTP